MIELAKSIDMEILLRLSMAVLLGLTIGVERELKRKSLGLKTILVISIVSCLLTIVSVQASYTFPTAEFTEIRMDPLRLAAQIVSGVGFLGAGVILRREDETVSGLTTAAMVWGAAGIGIATGAGFYIEATAGIIFLLISLKLIPAIVNYVGGQKLHVKELYLRIILKNRKDINKVIENIERKVFKIENIRIKDIRDGEYLIVLIIMVDDKKTTSEIYDEVSKINKIRNIEIRA